MKYLFIAFLLLVACDDGGREWEDDDNDECADADIDACFDDTCGSIEDCMGAQQFPALCECIEDDGCMDYFKSEYWPTDSNPC